MSEQPGRPTVAVVGAGIAGLAAAAAVRRAAPDLDVVVLDAAPAVGGKLALAEVGGVQVDVGAEAMLARRPEAVELARRSGLADRVVHPATTNANLWTRGRLHPLPRTLMGVPADLDALQDSGVLSEAGLARARQEPQLAPIGLDGDLSVGELVERRFGPEVVDRLVEPLLGGVYAGHARTISARAAVPQVVTLLERDGSLLHAAATAMRSSRGGPVFAGLAGGVGQLPTAVVREAGLDVRTATTVRGLTRQGDHWELVTGPTRDERRFAADAVVLATPARSTSRLLEPVAPVAARELAAVEYASTAIVTLAVRGQDLATTHGSGFLVPPVDGRAVKAATYSFAKWDWVRDAGASDGLLVLRCSLGRHREEATLQRSDEELVDVALADLADAVGLTGRPVETHVQRWGGALPQYAVGHLDRVARIRASVAEHPALAVCGAAYDGVGIPACIASAELAAARVLDALRVGEDGTHE